ncbi:MAG TPA: hypothetical protein VGK99_08465 [Acidobacteriota bacterium]|jgi:hypothetical protein
MIPSGGMRWFWLCLAFAATLTTAFAQQRPLITEIPDPVAEGKVRLEAGIEFLQNQPFSLTGLRGDSSRFGVIGSRFGLGSRVEFQIQGVAQDFLSIKARSSAPLSDRLHFSGDSTHAVGDLLFATKIRLRSESGNWPAFSFRIGALLPNETNESGMGLDTTRTFGALLLGKHIGKNYVFSNVGIMIVDDPTVLANQRDRLIYGLALIRPLNKHVQVMGEIYGATGNSGPGTDQSAQLRLGAQWRAMGLVWDLAGLAGLQKGDPDSGVIFGVSRDLEVFKTSSRPKSSFRFEPMIFSSSKEPQ